MPKIDAFMGRMIQMLALAIATYSIFSSKYEWTVLALFMAVWGIKCEVYDA